MDVRGVLAIVAAVVSLNHRTFAQNGGQLQLLLVNYSNPGNKLLDGCCCDPWLVCNACNTSLQICVVDTNSPSDGCRLGAITTDELASDDVINFGSEGHLLTPQTNMSNPLLFPFDGNWTGSVNVVITIWDKDLSKADDEVNKLDYFIRASAQPNNDSVWSSPVRRCGFYPRSCLTLLYRVVCNSSDLACNPPSSNDRTLETTQGSLRSSFASGSHIIVTEFSDVSQHCAAVNSSQSVIWTFKESSGASLALNTGRHLSSAIKVADGWMNLTSVKKFTAGMYICELDDNHNVTSSFVLFVRAPPVFVQIRQPPSTNNTNVLEANVSANISLLCHSEGFPPAALTWLHNNCTLAQPVSTNYGAAGVSGRIVSELSLELINVQVSQNGIYRCISNNGFGRKPPDKVIEIIIHDVNFDQTSNTSSAPPSRWTTHEMTKVPVLATSRPTTYETIKTTNTSMEQPSDSSREEGGSSIPVLATSRPTTYEMIKTTNASTKQPSESSREEGGSSSGSTGLMVALIVVILLVIAAIVVTVYCLRNKEKREMMLTYLTFSSARKREGSFRTNENYTSVPAASAGHHVNTAALLLDEEDSLSMRNSSSVKSKTSSLADTFALSDSRQSSLKDRRSPSPMMKTAESVLYEPSQSLSLRSKTSSLAGSRKILLGDSQKSSLRGKRSPSPLSTMKTAESALYTPSMDQNDALARSNSRGDSLTHHGSTVIYNEATGLQQARNILHQPSETLTPGASAPAQRESVVYAEPVYQRTDKSKTSLSECSTNVAANNHTYESISSLPQQAPYLDPVDVTPSRQTEKSTKQSSKPQYASAEPNYQEI